MKRDFKHIFSLTLVVAVLVAAFVCTAAPVAAAEGEITTPEVLVAANVKDATIVLGGDIEVDALFLAEGVNLDLNGHTLTADAVIGTAAGANVLDSSSDKTGLAKCPKTDGLGLREEKRTCLYGTVKAICSCSPTYLLLTRSSLRRMTAGWSVDVHC